MKRININNENHFLKIARKFSALASSALLCLFFNQNTVNAQEEVLFKENLREISNLEFKTEKLVDCPLGGSNTYYDREVVSYLQKNDVPITSNSNQQSNPRLVLYVDCLQEDNTVVYLVQLNIIQNLYSNGKTRKVALYDQITYGATPYQNFNRKQQEVVIEQLNSFIADWKSTR